jgi:hypothetical protein
MIKIRLDFSVNQAMSFLAEWQEKEKVPIMLSPQDFKIPGIIFKASIDGDGLVISIGMGQILAMQHWGKQRVTSAWEKAK